LSTDVNTDTAAGLLIGGSGVELTPTGTILLQAGGDIAGQHRSG
jgi:hypothetical protein